MRRWVRELAYLALHFHCHRSVSQKKVIKPGYEVREYLNRTIDKQKTLIIRPDSYREEESETEKPFCFEVHEFLIIMIPSYE